LCFIKHTTITVAHLIMIREEIIRILAKKTVAYVQPLINSIIDEYGKNPYLILIGCLLSLRAKDISTIHVCRDLFSRVKTPQELLALPEDDLRKIIFKTGFYQNKARVLREVSRTIIEAFDGRVPDTYEQLISIKGVGPKTANLVLGMAFDVPSICVDTHVHRISNRLGLIKTKTVEQTEVELKRLLDKKDWITWNKLLVIWGQNICAPISPKCSQCAISHVCKKVGVIKSR
jgi:endonuclease-3